eukprot:TRINITY_DN4071_c0_g1_i4.p1 TRINITY_DN4071_c0_g1~~TRINITY_DN4071_c0_g1_i4.p1  ORF type:complete len:556 (-),score=111.75 TRINITY_DN4071_c0_g1_i4:584-2251(-)
MQSVLQDPSSVRKSRLDLSTATKPTTPMASLLARSAAPSQPHTQPLRPHGIIVSRIQADEPAEKTLLPPHTPPHRLTITHNTIINNSTVTPLRHQQQQQSQLRPQSPLSSKTEPYHEKFDPALHQNPATPRTPQRQKPKSQTPTRKIISPMSPMSPMSPISPSTPISISSPISAPPRKPSSVSRVTRPKSASSKPPSPSRSSLSPKKNASPTKTKKSGKPKHKKSVVEASSDAKEEIEKPKRFVPKPVKEKADYLCRFTKCYFDEAATIVEHFQKYGLEPQASSIIPIDIPGEQKEIVTQLKKNNFEQYIEDAYGVGDKYLSKAMFYYLARLEYEDTFVKQTTKDVNKSQAFDAHQYNFLPETPVSHFVYELPEAKDFDKVVNSDALKVTIEHFASFLGSIFHGSHVEVIDTCFCLLDINNKNSLSNTDVFRILMSICDENEMAQILSPLEKVFSGGELVTKTTFSRVMRGDPRLLQKLKFIFSSPFAEVIGSARNLDVADDVEQRVVFPGSMRESAVPASTYRRIGDYMFHYRADSLHELVTNLLSLHVVFATA